MARISVLLVSLCLVVLMCAPLLERPAAGRSADAGEPDAGEPGTERGLLTRVVPRLAHASRQLGRALASQMREAARDGLPALVGLAAIALVCGMLQAAGPGHGKIVIASAFVSADIGWKAATGIAAALSTLQVVSAAAAVVLIGPLIAAGRPGAIRAAAVIELASYAAALPIAAGGSLSALLPPRRSTGPGRSRRGVPPITSALLLAVSMIPSAGAVTLALIAVAHGTLLAGAVAALAMAAGAAMTLAIVAIAGVGARIALVRILRVGSADLRARVVEALGWLVATIACAAFVWSAWIRLR